MTNELFFGLMGGTSTNATLQIEKIRFYSLQPPRLDVQIGGGNLVLTWPATSPRDGWSKIAGCKTKVCSVRNKLLSCPHRLSDDPQRMNRKTEEWLYQLLWLADCMSRPTFRNLTDTFEGWASRQGLLRQIQRLEGKELIESRGDTLEQKIYKLTDTGRLAALRGRDPEIRWKRDWDGQWRLVIFDLPETKNKLRVRLRRFLQQEYFGYLQNSVWITPDPLEPMARVLQEFAEDVESLILLEARPCGGESSAAIVQGAWQFDRVNHLYRGYLETLEQFSRKAAEGPLSPREFEQWSRRERAAWFEVIENDPLLPLSLLPADYLGRKAWEARKRLAKILPQQLDRR